MDLVEQRAKRLPRLLLVHHRDRLEQDTVFDGLGFEIVALFQVELLAEFRRDGDLCVALEFEQRNSGLFLSIQHATRVYEIRKL